MKNPHRAIAAGEVDELPPDVKFGRIDSFSDRLGSDDPAGVAVHHRHHTAPGTDEGAAELSGDCNSMNTVPTRDRSHDLVSMFRAHMTACFSQVRHSGERMTNWPGSRRAAGEPGCFGLSPRMDTQTFEGL